MYTDEELEAVTAQLLPTAIPRQFDTLGVRRTDRTFSAIQQAAAGVFLLYPNTPFYFAFLLSEALAGESRALSEACSELVASIATLRRRTIPVNDISALSNASSALIDLENVITSQAPTSLSSIPAYNRFESNTNRFLRKVASNIRQQAQLVSTPEESRKVIPGQIENVRKAFEALIARVNLLQAASENYHSIDLARKVSQVVVQNARILLQAREQDLQSRSATERLEVLRQTALEVLAAKGVVSKFGVFPPPEMGLAVFGTGSPYSDDEHPAVGAVLSSEYPGSYVLTPGVSEETSRNMLYVIRGEPTKFEGSVTVAGTVLTGVFSSVLAGDRVYARAGADFGKVRRVLNATPTTLTLEGPALVTVGALLVSVIAAPATLVYLPASIVPKLDGVQVGPYNVTNTNNSLQLEVSGYAPVTVTLTLGAARTAVQVAADLTAQLAGVGYKGEAYFLPLLFQGAVTTLGNVVSLPYGNFTGGLQIGDTVEFTFGPNAGEARTISALTASTLTLSGAVLVTTTIDQIRVGRARAVRITPVDPTQAMYDDVSIILRATNTVQEATGLLLGFTGQQLARTILTDTQSLVQFLNLNQGEVIAGSRDVNVTPDSFIVSTPSDARTVSILTSYGRGDWGSGTTVTINDLGRIEQSRPQVGDQVVLRGGANPDAVGSILSVTDTTVQALFASPVSAATNGSYEIGSPGSFLKGHVVHIFSGVNEGRYLVEDVHPTIPFQLVLRNVLPLYRTNFNRAAVMLGRVVQEAFTIQDRSTSVASKLSVFDPNLVFFSNYKSTVAHATSRYFQVPQKHKELGADDLLELYRGDTVTPSETRTVVAVEGQVVTLDEEVSADPANYTFAGASTAPVPSAVLRNGRTYDFAAFRQRLRQWLATRPAAGTALYFSELTRRVNPLLRNANPTDSDCADAENQVEYLRRLLTLTSAQANGFDTNLSLEVILSSYFIEKEPEADVLLRAFADQGADRAVDYLRSCRFAEFFGMDQQATSYGGALQKALHEVMREDLPVNRFDRDSAVIAPLRASIENTDFEYSSADLNENPKVDPPV